MNDSKYRQIFISDALKLDSVCKVEGKISQCAMSIAENGNKASVIELCNILYRISEEGDRNSRKLALVLKDDLIRLYGYESISKICSSNDCDRKNSEEEKTFNQLMVELNSLVGLSNVKSKVRDLIAFQKVQKLRKDNGLAGVKSTMHLAFIGNPGTGKTTVARIIGHIYRNLGLLSSGHFIEVSRTDLIAGYQGQTALKVKKVIEKAKGGVLFIDEAYSITENEKSDSYGRECLTELTKALEDYREDLVVIVAGYTEPMKLFFDSNPGLKSRFSNFIEFEDYNADELLQILERMCIANDYELDHDTYLAVRKMLEKTVEDKGDCFANGRMVRNLYDSCIMNQARRISVVGNPTLDDLRMIRREDLENLNLDERV